MAQLRSNTTIGGYQAIHAGNINQFVPDIIRYLFRYLRPQDMTPGTGASLTSDSQSGSGYCITITQPSSGATQKTLATYQMNTTDMLHSSFSVSFRLKSNNTSTTNIITMSVLYSNDGTTWTTLASTTLKGSDFRTANEYYTFPVVYESKGTYLKFQVDVLAVNSLSVALDYILIQPSHGVVYA